MTINRIGINERMSQAVVHNGVVYLSGQVPHDLSGDIIAQTKEVLDSIDRLLGEVGSDKSKLLAVTIYLADITSDFSGMNAAWDSWVGVGATPARATVEAALYDPGVRVEMSVVAAK